MELRARRPGCWRRCRRCGCCGCPIAVAGLIDRFEPAIFLASMVARGKPDPDLFLHAARAMGAKPQRCLVIEDSPTGIAAARNAGMRVFAYVGGNHLTAPGLCAEIDALAPDAVSTTCVPCPAWSAWPMPGRQRRTRPSFWSRSTNLTLVGGTSSSVLALSPDPRPATGVWGPFYGAVLPDAWLTEAGQSATGGLLDHLIRWHSAGGEPTPQRHTQIIERVTELRRSEGVALANRLHVVPDFHGNRSPLGDPEALGVISGLTLASDFDSLCRLYWRASVAIALGVRHVVETLADLGYGSDTLLVAGGHTRNPLLMELYADATGCTVVEPRTQDATLLGMAMVAANAAGLYGSLAEAAAAMAQGGRERRPDPETRKQFEKDYRVFREMLVHRQALDAIR